MVKTLKVRIYLRSRNAHVVSIHVVSLYHVFFYWLSLGVHSKGNEWFNLHQQVNRNYLL